MSAFSTPQFIDRDPEFPNTGAGKFSLMPGSAPWDRNIS